MLTWPSDPIVKKIARPKILQVRLTNNLCIHISEDVFFVLKVLPVAFSDA